MPKKKEKPETEATPAPVPAFEVKVVSLDEMALSDLHDLQGGFKELSPANEARLRGEILALGLCEPFTAGWIEAEQKFYLLNGHQRARVIKKLQDEGLLAADAKFPVTQVSVKDKAQAIEICLSLTSQYGTVNKAGLAKLATKAKLDLNTLQERFNFPELELANLQASIEKDKAEEGEDPNEKKGKRHKKVTCPKCGHAFDVKA